MAPIAQGPLILLSPAKSLSFDSKLSAALSAIKPTSLRFHTEAKLLTSTIGKMSKAQIKSMMGLSDSLAALNHARFSDFDSQPSRPAVCAFEGAAYKGLDAPSLSSEALDYCQDHLRILCGLYGVLRPYDEIRPCMHRAAIETLRAGLACSHLVSLSATFSSPRA